MICYRLAIIQTNKMNPLNQQELTGLRYVEQTLEAYNRLILKEQSCRIQLDKPAGQEYFRQYVATIQHLMNQTKASRACRMHRDRYTNAYKVLYEQGALGYIPQIYDSAQESYPLIFVNGQRYDFSAEVLLLGERLVEAHFRLIHQLRVAVLKTDSWRDCMKVALQQLDTCWVNYEEKYITQLIRIQQHAKTIIHGFIEAEKNLFDFQTQQKLRGKIFLSGSQYESLRKKLSQSVSRLNAVANIEGKGRDDLGIEVLLAAQQVLASVTEDQAKSIRILADKIRSSWDGVREVLRFFGDNFEMVDPQLRNNLQLVAALRDYQNSWQRGKRFFLEKQKESQILACSAIVQSAKQKYPKFRESLEESDPKIFWIIPSLIVLRSLQGEDQGLTQSSFEGISFLSKKIEYQSLKNLYLQKKKQSLGSFSHYNRLQQLLVRQQQPPEQFLALVNHIKQLAINLERICPSDWNDMLGVLLLAQE